VYQNRLELYKEIEKRRDSKLLVYVTGDRTGLETKIHSEVLNFFVDHLDIIGDVPKISLYLYTRGGDTLAAWSIANLIRQYCEEFEVLIPAKAHSGGTLISLGANTIIMTKQATLGPIDPNINTPINPPIPGAPPNIRYPVSVEAISGFIELAKKEVGGETGADPNKILEILASHVEPLVLGQVYRTRAQIKMLGERLLSLHMEGDGKIEKILAFLCSESGSHDYTIYHREARKVLGLNVTLPNDDLYTVIKKVYDDIADELALTRPYRPDVFLGEQDEAQYKFSRALVESVNGGSHKFISKGRLIKQQITDQNTGIVREIVQDNRTFEGWKHE